jgi:hypothetical protein
MTDNHHPQAVTALARSTPLCPSVYEALESGTEVGRTFFELPGNTWDGWLFSHLVRYEALRRLKLLPQDDFFVDGLPNTGIALYCKGTQYRVFKATQDGRLPPPRESEGLKEFYNQLQMPLFPENSSALSPPSSRLVLLWDIDGNRNLSTLYLVCPRSADDSDWKPGLEHWRIPVPHPAEMIEQLPQITSEGELLVLEPVDGEQSQDD